MKQENKNKAFITVSFLVIAVVLIYGATIWFNI